MYRQLKDSVKAVLAWLTRRRRARELKESVRHVTRAELAAGLREMGIEAGDALFIHSSLKSLGFVEGGPAAVIGALQDAVGPDGTVVIPTYYMPGGTILATCQLTDYEFDVRKHGTNLGRLPEAFLATPGIHRSVHPTHSVSAWGKHAKYVTEAHHKSPSVFGEGSPWNRFLDVPNAKVVGLGVSMGPVTFYHMLEDAMGDDFPEPVWQDQTYLLPCRDHAGNLFQVPVRPFDAKFIEGRRIDHPSRNDLREYFRKEFERAKLRSNGKVGQADSWFINGPAFFLHLKKLANEKTTIYSLADHLKSNGHPEQSNLSAGT